MQQPALVRDVMTQRVVTATAATPVRRIARLLALHRVDSVAIVDDDNRVLGVVRADDLVPVGVRDRGTPGRTAADVMSTRPPTIPVDAPLPVAAVKFRHSDVDRLLVVGDDRLLLGVVSRADVLRPVTRSDTAVHEDVSRALRRTLWIDPSRVHVGVHRGVVTLTGTVARRTTAADAVRLAGHVSGVATVVDHLRFEFDDTELVRPRAS